MRCAYFDCFGGAAGDMILAALLHAGLSPTVLERVVAALGLKGVTLEVSTVRRGELSATHLQVRIDPAREHHHRHLPEILALIERAPLSAAVRQQAARVFRRLAEAEASVHGIPVEKVHFHEVGADDALVDIVGACAGLEALDIAGVQCSPIPTGFGTITCAHGVLPVPAPATAELLRGVPLTECNEAAELTTPTGAAILTTLATRFGPLPSMRLVAIGYGAGMRENQTRANVLRVLVGELIDAAAADSEADQIMVLEASMDDVGGQTLAHAVARLLEAGALDAYTVPIMMKKGRPGQLLTVLCRPTDAAALEDVIFEETTTFGVRRHAAHRRKLARQEQTVETPFGTVRLKIGRHGQRVLRVWPEYEDCAAAARANGVALRAVQQAALREWTRRHEQQPDGGSG